MKKTRHRNFLFFYLILFCILCLFHFFIYYAFFHKIEVYRQYWFCFTLFLLLCNIAFFVLHHNFHPPYKIDLFLSCAVGISFVFFIGALFFCLCISPLFLFGSKEQYAYFVPIIRNLCLVLVFVSICYGFFNGIYKQLKINNITLEISGLKEALKVLQISDLHIDTFLKAEYIKKIISQSNALNPDIIVLTGDIVDAKSAFVAEKINLLKNLKAKYGIYYVLGNHEYFHDTKEILENLKNNGITILNNTSSTIIASQKALINIIGITDFFGEKTQTFKPDIQQAMLKSTPNIPNILLSHQPKVIHYLKDENIQLVLSGHTHGGQIFPFNFLVLLQQPYIKGLHEFKPKSFIYISQGSGTWGPPMRIGTENEITLITLKPAP